MKHTWGKGTAERRRLIRPAHVALALVVGATGALVTVASQAGTAEAAPERVLQAVDVKVGDDGRVASITSRAVRDPGEGGKVTEDVEELDAATLASQLPIRVQTTWRLGDRTGTDLSDIEGAKGRVVIDLTVQNTTVQPRQVSFDAGGVSRQRWALVGTPLTVVASADLGEDSYSSVVVQDDMHPDDITNGVLGRGTDNNAQVQWATMLAPPRLGASATLRLVQDTDDFEVPRFDLSVQPGLVTDTSLRSLLEAAFGDADDSSLTLEKRTISLITSVTSVLTEASSVLARIQTELNGSATTLGARTISDLQGSSSEVSSSLSGLTQDLDSLSADIAGQLRQTNDQALRALQGSVDQVSRLLGDPDKVTPPTITDQPDGCTVAPLPEGKRPTVIQQIAAVSGQLTALAGATSSCRATIKQGLLDTVGSVQPDGTCAPLPSAVCGILGVGNALTNQITAIQVFSQGFASRFDPALVQNITTTATALEDAVSGLAESLGGLGTGTAPIKTQLANADKALTDALALLQPSGGATLASEVGSLRTSVDGAVTALTGATGGAAADLRSVRTTVCATPGSAADAASVTLVGVDCATPEPTTAPAGSLLARFQSIDSVRTSLSTVATGLKDVGDDLAAVTTAVQNAQTAIRTASGSTGTVGTQVGSAYCTVAAIILSAKDFPTAACGTAPAEVSPLDALRTAVTNLQEKQGTLTSASIVEAFTGALNSLQLGTNNAAQQAQQIAQAGQEAADRTDSLIGGLEAQLSSTGDQVFADGAEAVRRSRDRLATTAARSGAQLTAGVDDTVRRIDADVASSNRNVAASQRLLLADLRKVLLDLGERKNNGSGLLGSLVTGATATGVSNDRIQRATDTAIAFSRVRAQGLDDLLLQQAQTALSLQLQAQFPIFGIDLPEGSTHQTVFSVQVGA
ncbi:hypothetical protein GCM10022215_07490 [Nocardioides fonticola]|uniref:Uncharacterized protein n=1 Tax=Nocardioides fonticola TaxID=450363 RepID=A0ABP7XCJ5_9ACTN